MKKYVTVREGQLPTKQQLVEIEALKTSEARPDEEMPELSIDELRRFQKTSEQRRKDRQKQVLTLRVSGETMRKAKALGKGYTGILSRMLELGLNDPELIEKCL